MRRMSDRQHGERTGAGRRARDRILAGELCLSPSLKERQELQDRLLFLAEDLRESAIAIGGIEAFLLKAQRTLEKPELAVEDLHGLLADGATIDRIDLLADALLSLRRTIGQVQAAIGTGGEGQSEPSS